MGDQSINPRVAQPDYMAGIWSLFGASGQPTGLSVDDLAQLSGESRESVLAKLHACGIKEADDPDFRLTTATFKSNDPNAGPVIDLLKKIQGKGNLTVAQQANIELLLEAADESVPIDHGFVDLAEFDKDGDHDVDAVDLDKMTPEEKKAFVAKAQATIVKLESTLKDGTCTGLEALDTICQLADLQRLIDRAQPGIDLNGPQGVTSLLKGFNVNGDQTFDEADVAAVLASGSPERVKVLRTNLASAMANIETTLEQQETTLSPVEVQKLQDQLDELHLLAAKTGVLPTNVLTPDIDLSEFDADGDGYITTADVACLPPEKRTQLLAQINDKALPAINAHLQTAAPGSQEAALWTALKDNAQAVVAAIQTPPAFKVTPGSPLESSAAVANDADKQVLNEADVRAMNSEQLQTFVRAADAQLRITGPGALTPEQRQQLTFLREIGIQRLTELCPTAEEQAKGAKTDPGAEAVLEESLTDGLNVTDIMSRLLGMLAKMRYQQRGAGWAMATRQFDVMVSAAAKQFQADKEKAIGEIVSGAVGLASAVASFGIGAASMGVGIGPFKLKQPQKLEQPLDKDELARLEADNKLLNTLRDAENPKFTALDSELKGYETNLSDKKYELGECTEPPGGPNRTRLESEIAQLQAKKRDCEGRWNTELNEHASLKDYNNITASLDVKIKNLKADIDNPVKCPPTPAGRARQAELKDQLKTAEAQKKQVEALKQPRELEIAKIDQNDQYLALADRNYVCEMKKDPVRWEQRNQDPRYQEAQARHAAAVQKVQNKANSLAFMGQPIGQGLNSLGQGLDDIWKLFAAGNEHDAKILQAISDLAQRGTQISDQDEQQIEGLFTNLLSALADVKRYYGQMQI